jgi:hypothetical protein
LRPRPWRPVLIGSAVVLTLIAALVAEIIWTRPVREAVATYLALMSASNHNDPAAARPLCTRRYLQVCGLELAPEGGLKGIPRNLHKNFQAWRQGRYVWICPTNRIGPIYQFVRENGRWRYDGLVGTLISRGRIELDRDPDGPPRPLDAPALTRISHG